MKISPFNTVICFHHIDFEGKERSLAFLAPHGMEALKGDECAISDEPPRNKSTLVF
jgi:hypothetical protein